MQDLQENLSSSGGTPQPPELSTADISSSSGFLRSCSLFYTALDTQVLQLGSFDDKGIGSTTVESFSGTVVDFDSVRSNPKIASLPLTSVYSELYKAGDAIACLNIEAKVLCHPQLYVSALKISSLYLQQESVAVTIGIPLLLPQSCTRPLVSPLLLLLWQPEAR